MVELDNYKKAEQELFDYFGYVENWVAIPVEDSREYWWELDQDENGSGEVRFAETEELLADKDAGEYYCEEIYTQRFLPKWVYKGTDYTMICVDTCVDGNKFLRIFSNNLEVK